MKRFLGLLVVVAAVVAGAAFGVPSEAASVNGAGITQASLNADLSAIAGSTGYQCYLGADLELTGQSTAGLFPVLGAGAATGAPTVFRTAFVRYWLSQRMSGELMTQAVAARHLAVGPADLALGRATLAQQIDGVFSTFQSTTGQSCGATAASLLASLPRAFVSEQVRAQATQDVLLAHESGYGLGAASLLRYFSTHRAQFDTICVSYVAFPSESAATLARAAVATGTPLASTGTVTPLGCAMRAAITSLPSSVTTLPVGQVSQPVAGGSGGYALLEVTSSRKSTFAAARSEVQNAVLAAGSARTTALLRAANRVARVTADPRYGRVVPHTIELAAPQSPRRGVVLNPAADVAARQTSPSPSPPTGSGSG